MLLNERRRKVLRAGLLAAAILAAACVVVVLAWLATNLIDIAPRPRPPELAVAQKSLTDERNRFFDLLVLTTERDATGLRRAGIEAWSRLLRQPAAAADADGRAADRPVPPMSGPPYVCPGGQQCASHWLRHAAALATQLEKHAELGRRCESVAARFEFEELLASPPSIASPVAPHAVGASACIGWFNARSVAAWHEGDLDATVRLLAEADMMSRRLLAGSRSLVGHAVAWRQVRNTWQTAHAIGVADARLWPGLRGLFRPLATGDLHAKRWIPYEADFQHASVDEMLDRCSTDSAEGEAGWLVGRMCRWRLGMLPNQSHADIDQGWLRTLRAAGAGEQALLTDLIKAREAAESEGMFEALNWRNTVMRMLFDVGRPMYGQYLARAADVELHRAALSLALDMLAANVPAAERAEWLASRTSGTVLHGRHELKGNTLRVVTWQEELHADVPARDRIQIDLPN